MPGHEVYLSRRRQGGLAAAGASMDHIVISVRMFCDHTIIFIANHLCKNIITFNDQYRHFNRLLMFINAICNNVGVYPQNVGMRV